MSRRVFFDMTDIVRYAVGNDRVSGIQRVQFNLIGHLSRKHGGDVVRCVFHHDTLGMVEFDPAPLFAGDEFDSAGLLQHLDLEKPRRMLPPRSKVKSYLRRYNHNKQLRALHKIDLVLSSLLSPSRLHRRFGLERQTRTYPVLPMTPVTSLPKDAQYVTLSINTSLREVVAFMEAHVKQGGGTSQIVYDLIPHVRPEFFTPSMVDNYHAWLDDMLRTKPRVVCISDCTARDLKAYIGADSATWDIRAIPLAHEFDGFARNTSDVPGLVSSKLPKGPYVLCVGTLEVRKNGLSLLEAWQQVVAELGDQAPQLVFAGKKGWLMDKFWALLEGNAVLRRKVHFAESPSDRELAWLYQHCLFTAYPSHYEGWGLPVGEAAWFGKFGIVSNASSIPEVCGDLYDYVAPTDVDALAQRLLHALRHPGYVREKEAAVRAAPLRRWSDVADDIFREVGGEPVATRSTA